MRFIHAADLHLDSPLRGLSAYPEAPAERLRTATREALVNLVSRAIEERVDFLVIAGDVYDGDWKDFHTGLFFVRQMGRLRQAGVPVFLIHGNHDAESDMTRSLELPDNVHVFSSRKAETVRLEGLRVALHGQSFRVRETTENLVPGYPDPVPGWLNIGILHTGLEGGSEHARYAPCSVAELKAKGYQYWALGHVHEPWHERGLVTLAYPGNLQGRHVREQGARGALLVTASEDEIFGLERLDLDVLRWHRLQVDVQPVEDRRGALQAAGQGLERLLQEAPDHITLAVRVEFTGPSAAFPELVADPLHLREEVRSKALALDPDRLWIEKVKVEAQPLHELRAPGADEIHGALAELIGFAQSAHEDEDFVRQLVGDWSALLDKLPPEVRELSEDLKDLHLKREELVAERLRQALPLLSSRVVSPPGSSN